MHWGRSSGLNQLIADRPDSVRVSDGLCMRLQMLLSGMVLLGPGPVTAQTQVASLEPPGAMVAALDVALYNTNATSRAPTDSAVAVLATEVLHTTLAELLPDQFADPAAVHAATRSDTVLALAGRHGCNVVVACARAVAQRVDARWVVLAKMSRVAAVWLLTAQLVHVPSGATVLDYTAELTGQDAMVRAGARNLARRIVRSVRAGGAASDLPSP
jgi:hypothetical protein